MRAWWHRCASLSHEINTIFSLFRMYHAFEQLFWHASCLGDMEGITYQNFDSLQMIIDNDWNHMIRGDWVGMYYYHSVCMYYDHSQRQQMCKRTRFNMTNFMPNRSNRKLDPSPLWLFMSDSYPSILKMTWLTSSTISMSMFTTSVLTDVQQDKVEHERNHDKKLLIACLISCLFD